MKMKKMFPPALSNDRRRPFRDVPSASSDDCTRPFAALPAWYPVRKECAHKRSFSWKTGRLELAFGLMWLTQERRGERDPQTRGDPGGRRRRVQPACRCRCRFAYPAERREAFPWVVLSVQQRELNISPSPRDDPSPNPNPRGDTSPRDDSPSPTDASPSDDASPSRRNGPNGTNRHPGCRCLGPAVRAKARRA